MTDNEIIKALECCSTDGRTCEACPYDGQTTDEIFCDEKLQADALALINRQRGEIERLEELVYSAENETANVRDLYKEQVDYWKKNAFDGCMEKSRIEKTAKAEAIKLFATRVKELNNQNLFIWNEQIDNLVKEMVGAE